VISNVKCYSSLAERDSLTSYPGPDFNTLEPKMQEIFDELLSSVGVNEELIDFIEHSNDYYNNFEFIHWISNISNFLNSFQKLK
jgi:complement component 1 Q subcomponent-binding protein